MKSRKPKTDPNEITYSAFEMVQGEWFGEVLRGGVVIKTLDYHMPTEGDAEQAAAMWMKNR